jgi:hypothetical protein
MNCCVCIRSCLKSVLRYKFLMLDTYNPDTLDLRERGFEDLWLLFGAQRGSRTKRFGNIGLKCFIYVI